MATRVIKIKAVNKNGHTVKSMELTAKVNLQGLYGDEWNKKVEEITEELFDYARKRFSLKEISIK